MPKPLVEELEQDELDQYDDGVKQKLKQMRKVWHDERREKEAALREQQEAIELAQKYMGENQRMRQMLDTGGKEYARL
jgi:cell shape-determining protein MreC